MAMTTDFELSGTYACVDMHRIGLLDYSAAIDVPLQFTRQQQILLQ